MRVLCTQSTEYKYSSWALNRTTPNWRTDIITWVELTVWKVFPYHSSRILIYVSIPDLSLEWPNLIEHLENGTEAWQMFFQSVEVLCDIFPSPNERTGRYFRIFGISMLASRDRSSFPWVGKVKIWVGGGKEIAHEDCVLTNRLEWCGCSSI